MWLEIWKEIGIKRLYQRTHSTEMAEKRTHSTEMAENNFDRQTYTSSLDVMNKDKYVISLDVIFELVIEFYKKREATLASILEPVIEFYKKGGATLRPCMLLMITFKPHAMYLEFRRNGDDHVEDMQDERAPSSRIFISQPYVRYNTMQQFIIPSNPGMLSIWHKK